MQRRFVIAWLLGMTQVMTQAGDWNPDPATRLRLPRIFRSGRTQFDPQASPWATQDSSIFDLRASVSSQGDVVEIQAPMPDELLPEDDADQMYRDRRNVAPIQYQESFPPEQMESTFPPPPSGPRALSTEAIPLDAAPRDDVQPDEQDDDKFPLHGDYSALGWIAGSKDRLGMWELDFKPSSRVWFDPLQPDKGYLGIEWGARWLNGPDVTDLPPYLFNILINVGQRFTVDDRLAIDAMISPGWFTDFSNKGHQAFRLPWHVVSYYKLDGDWHWVTGVTDLARDDIHILPVLGAVFAPVDGDIRLDLVFPKPRIAWRFADGSGLGHKWQFGSGSIGVRHSEAHWLTLGGELGGGSWSITRSDHSYDVMTYRDYRLVAGVETRWVNGGASRLEIGWIFNRAVQYRSGDGNYSPPDSLMIRISSDY